MGDVVLSLDIPLNRESCYLSYKEGTDQVCAWKAVVAPSHAGKCFALQYLLLPWRQNALPWQNVQAGICSSSIKERKSKHREGGRWLQVSQKIAQEGITLPGTSDRWDFLLPMVACGNADFSLLPFFLLSGATPH